ncbi:hypothetical protein C3F09_01525 [candidate division GN15 bacterium]|uniref:Uncharacterized protein n=1 Tax=candidate division GN15 bacterium TaxID=2072418 RepID=A0A855X468_9BACT|nr:MAG: hypothetical protein C3F09_01525 [candidate division GN15 bacterium]
MGNEGGGESKKPQQPYWLIYLGILLAGLLMLGHAAHFTSITRIPAKLAIGLLYSAFALFVGNGRPSGFIGTAILWAAIIISFLV